MWHRSALLIPAALLVALPACGPVWSTASAVDVPNPVLLGPVTYVGEATDEPQLKHALGKQGALSLPMWSMDASSTTGYGYRETRSEMIRGAARALSFALLESLWPYVHDPMKLAGNDGRLELRMQEAYRTTDVVRVGRLRVKAFAHRTNVVGDRTSHRTLTLDLVDAYFFHQAEPERAPPADGEGTVTDEPEAS